MKLVRPFVAVFIFILAGTAIQAQTNCLKVDLQAVSISPVSASLESGKMTRVEVVMLNNGPCEIPRGEATAQITINTDHLEVPEDPGFKDECGLWSFVTSTTSGASKNLFFRNNGATLPVGSKSCAFYFNVKAKSKSPGIVTITLASSLSASAKTSDMNGNNQSAYAEIIIKGVAEIKPVKAEKPLIKLDGKPDECTAKLKWEYSGNDVDSFDIESGFDKVNFNKIASSPLNESSSNDYKFETDQVNSKKYYRLKVIYKDGSSGYSLVSEIETKCKVKKGF